MIFYSKTTKGFYDYSIHGSNMPEDAEHIDAEDYAILIEGQSRGLIITEDASGHPVLSSTPSPTRKGVSQHYIQAIEDYMDRVAQANGYDNRINFALRAGYAGPYHDEGVAFAQWMDGCYAWALPILNNFNEAGTALPDVDAFVASLPKFV